MKIIVEDSKAVASRDSGTGKSEILTKSPSVSSADKINKPSLAAKSISQMSDYEVGAMPVSDRVIMQSVQKVNKALSGGNRRFEFSIHEKTNQVVLKIFDSETNDLIKEIPNEKVLDMVAKICEMSGVLVDERR